MHVLILDSNPTIRRALGLLFAAEGDVTVSVHAELPARPGAFDVALVDASIAGAFNEDTRATLRSLSQQRPVVVMGMGERAGYEEAHIAAGAVGYWPKDDDVEPLLALVRAAGLVAQADRAVTARRSFKASHRRRTRRAAVSQLSTEPVPG
jgi:DNA-binding NarL/FixJ family response regulator